MTKSKNDTSQLSDYTGNPGPGLWPDDRHTASLDRCYNQSLKFLISKDFTHSIANTPNFHKNLRNSLQKVCLEYWSDKDFDNRTSPKKIKDEIKSLSKPVERILSLISELSPGARKALNGDFPYGISGSRSIITHKVSLTEEALKSMHAAIAARSLNVKTRFPRHAVKNACLKLSTLWTVLTGEDFYWSYDVIKRTKRSIFTTGAQEFLQQDKLFVQIALQAIDPLLKVAEIRSGIRGARQSRSTTK